jgi:hypothetical protein
LGNADRDRRLNRSRLVRAGFQYLAAGLARRSQPLGKFPPLTAFPAFTTAQKKPQALRLRSLESRRAQRSQRQAKGLLSRRSHSWGPERSSSARSTRPRSSSGHSSCDGSSDGICGRTSGMDGSSAWHSTTGRSSSGQRSTRARRPGRHSRSAHKRERSRSARNSWGHSSYHSHRRRRRRPAYDPGTRTHSRSEPAPARNTRPTPR